MLEPKPWSEVLANQRLYVEKIIINMPRGQTNLFDIIAETEDLASKVFAQAYQKLDEFEGNDLARFESWLRSIARNCCRNRLKKLRTSKNSPLKTVPIDEVTGDPCLFEDDGGDPALTVMNRDEIKAILDRLKQRFEAKMYETFLLHLLGFSYREIADIQEINISTARIRVFRVRRYLNSEIQAEQKT